MTSKEALNIYLGGNMNVATLTPEAIRDFMVSFARHHVEKAIKIASKELDCYDMEVQIMIKSYPLENIV